MSGVVDGSPVNASNTNSAFLDANGDDYTIGIFGLQNTLPVSGAIITNTQRAINNVFAFIGMADETVTSHDDSSGPLTYLSGDNLDTRVRKLDASLSNTTTGHNHNGTNSRKINFLDLLSIQLLGYAINGTNFTSPLSSSKDVSSLLTGETPSTGQTIKGIAVNNPYNYCPLFDSNDDSILDGSGNKVYGRLTESSGVWNLSFYSNISGTETAYSFTSAVLVKWFYQKLFDESDRPVYSDVLVRSSDQVAGTIPDASLTNSGKVNLSSQSYAGLKTFSDGLVVQKELSISRFDIAGAASIAALTYKPFTKITGTTETYILGVGSGSDGKSTIIHNGTNQPLHIQNLDGGALAGDRIKLPLGQNITLKPDQSIELIYDSNQSLWIQKSGSGNGTGSGGSGINMVGLDATFQPNFQDDINAENTIGNAAVYNDGAAVPVDMTGGTATITLTRTVTSTDVLNGSGSFKLTKPASNCLGNGYSLLVNIPIGYRGKRHRLFFPWKVLSGSYVAGDLLVYFYDVDNSKILNPGGFDLINMSNQIDCVVDIPDTTKIRIGIHFASTSTSAITFSFDDVFLGLSTPLVGPNIDDMKSDLTFSPDPTAFGTVTNEKYYYKIVGDTLHVRGYFSTGSVTPNLPFIKLAGFEIDSNKVNSDGYKDLFGTAYGVYSTTVSLGAANVLYAITWDGINSDRVHFVWREVGATNNGYILGNDNANSLLTSGTAITFEFQVPIKGRSANVAAIPSGVIRISDVLSSGTRITGTAPTKLGEYRSYLRNASATTFTETNGNPSDLPTSSNGVAIYLGGGFTSADASNKPSRYEIFIGKNKKYSIEYYLNSGRTGYIDAKSGFYVANLAGNVRDLGWNVQYDPNTGIINIVRPLSYQSSVEDAHQIVLDNGSPSGTAGDKIYFDIFVANNDYQIQQRGNLPVYLKEVQPNGTDPGGFTSGVWQIRNLNTIENNQPWVSFNPTFGVNEFTLQPGYYKIKGQAPAFFVNSHQTRIFNITDSATEIIGSPEYSDATGTGRSNSSNFMGMLKVLGNPKTYRLEHRCQTTRATTGVGIPDQSGTFGVDGVYAQMEIEKIC